MNLPPDDARLFFKLMCPLHVFVNNAKGVVPGVDTMAAYIKTPNASKQKMRDAMFAEPHLIDDFIAANRQNLNADESAIVAGWRHFVKGEYIVERFLARYAVFIKNTDVYAVNGLNTPLQAMVHAPLPVSIDTVLLPFRGRIVYDGFMQDGGIRFGASICAEFREIYLAAKQNGRIIHALGPDSDIIPVDDIEDVAEWAEQAEALDRAAKALGRGARNSPLIAAVFRFARVSTGLARKAVLTGGNPDEIGRDLRKVARALKNLYATHERASE
ncbi:MAG: hypothetical protein ABIF71_10365 [Planctomycetota bacterium]